MDRLAAISMLWDGMRKRVMRGVPKDEAIVFIDAQRGADDLVVTICRGFSPDYLSWSEFKSLGSFATSAVVAAGWSCRKLDQIAESVREGLFLEEELDQLREQARHKRNRVYIRRPSD
ncbi:uncharacterized protein N7525_001395 [Penicillium rubens]|uniref:uncharacterized protein n=1 Tax=Penicillium rubens TaxID=1108849 RepID=UPI002A59E197|nr:uncharacterized protein N7525_001395 [Penicillium rubens]KAJ5843654.1 hypothetical protein N7525_001395 [Penicillium rubens]KAJ5845759.1 hypothetical protein N7534_009428 [Penicillium rubens]